LSKTTSAIKFSRRSYQFFVDMTKLWKNAPHCNVEAYLKSQIRIRMQMTWRI